MTQKQSPGRHTPGKPTTTTTATMLRPGCKLAAAAGRLADPKVMAAVARYHPPFHCPAARLERAA